MDNRSSIAAKPNADLRVVVRDAQILDREIFGSVTGCDLCGILSQHLCNVCDLGNLQIFAIFRSLDL